MTIILPILQFAKQLSDEHEGEWVFDDDDSGNVAESFDETKVKRDDEGQFAKQEGRSSVNSDTSAIADKAPISDSGPESSGDPEKPRRTDTPEFKRWFGKSKVVGKDGEPLVVYHGTSRDFDQFEKGKLGTSTNTIVNGFFFTDDPEQAGEFAIGIGRNVKPVFLSLQNPMVIDADGRNIQAVLGAHEEALARDRGHDGFIVRNVIDAAGMVMTAAGYSSAKPTTLYIAFEPEQIKSAISNRGTYDPKSPKITESTSLELSRDGQIRQITTRPVARESQAMSLREAATGLARALVQQTAPPEPARYRDAVVAVASRVSEFCNVPAEVLLQRHIDPAVFGPWKARPIKAQESVSWQRAPDVLEEWTRYEGERGGKGWQWNGQGEPRYQEEKPSEPGGESSNIQPCPANRQEAGPSGATPPVAKPEGGKMTLSQQMLDQAKEQHGQWPDQGWDKVADTLAGLPDAERAKVDAYLASGDFKNRSKKLANRIKSGKTPIVPMNEDEQAAAQQARQEADAARWREEQQRREQEAADAKVKADAEAAEKAKKEAEQAAGGKFTGYLRRDGSDWVAELRGVTDGQHVTVRDDAHGRTVSGIAKRRSPDSSWDMSVKIVDATVQDDPMPAVVNGKITLPNTSGHAHARSWDKGSIAKIGDAYYRVIAKPKAVGSKKEYLLAPATADDYASRPGKIHLGTDHASRPMTPSDLKAREGQAIQTKNGEWFHVKKFVVSAFGSGEGDEVFGHHWYGKGNYVPADKAAKINAKWAKTPEGRQTRLKQIAFTEGWTHSYDQPEGMAGMTEISGFGHQSMAGSERLYSDGNRAVRATSHYDDGPNYYTKDDAVLAKELLDHHKALTAKGAK